MAINAAFQIKGKTTRINVSTTANTVAILADSPSTQLRLHNGTAAEVFIHISSSATGNAVVPVANTASYGLVLHNNQTQIFTAPGQATDVATVYVSAITASGNGIVYVTPGEGL
jgi:hypothetical protein